jgi:TRAP-type C4-dicarboxylate transport system substrate-binding protein
MKRIMTLTASTAALVMAAGPTLAQEKWDLPAAYPASNFHTETLVEFAECVRSGTDGAIDITVHPNGSLFAGAEIKRAIQTGQVAIGERLLSGNQNENAIYGVDSIPFLVSSFDEHAKLWDAAKPTMEKVLEGDNLKLIYSLPWPPQGLYFRDEVSTMADMEGVKFRTYNVATSRIAELTGMRPVQIEAAEIAQAFATGVADGMASSGATGYEMKSWESLNYFYAVDAWLPRNYTMVNADTWNGLDGATQTTIMDCGAKSEEVGVQRAKDYTQFTLDGLAAGGMTVGRANDEVMTGLREVGETMTEEWIKAAGEEGRAIVDAYRAK